MTKSVVMRLILILVAAILIGAFIIRDRGNREIMRERGNREPLPPESNRVEPESNRVEIKGTQGAGIYLKLPEGEEQYLNNVPAVVDVPVGATVTLKHNGKEKRFSPEDLSEKTEIRYDFPPKVDRVRISADPDAQVFIKRSETAMEEFIDDVPITVDVPIGATIILRYNNKEKRFLYEEGTNEERVKKVFHDFSK